MEVRSAVMQGTMDLLVLKVLSIEPMHGWGISERIASFSGDAFRVNQGSLYPALLKLEQEGFIAAEWRQSENNRRAKYYSLTAAGRKQVARETREWHQTADLIAAFLAPRETT